MSKEKEHSVDSPHDPSEGERASTAPAHPIREGDAVSEEPAPAAVQSGAAPRIAAIDQPAKLTKKERKQQKKDRLREKRGKKDPSRTPSGDAHATVPSAADESEHAAAAVNGAAIAPAPETATPSIMSRALQSHESPVTVAESAPVAEAAELQLAQAETNVHASEQPSIEPAETVLEMTAVAKPIPVDPAPAEAPIETESVEPPAPPPAEHPGDGLKDESAPASISTTAVVAAPPPQAAETSDLVPCNSFRRLAATAFDLLFLATANILAVAIYLGWLVHIFLKPLSATEPDPLLAPERSEEMLLFVAGLLLFNYLYYAFCECWPLKGTLGKHVFNLRVVGTTRARVSIFRSNYRLLCRVVTAGTFGIGYLIAFVRPHHTLHDRLSRTMVVHVSELKKLKAPERK